MFLTRVKRVKVNGVVQALLFLSMLVLSMGKKSGVCVGSDKRQEVTVG